MSADHVVAILERDWALARIAALEALIETHNAKCRARCEACGNYPACDGLCPRNCIIHMPGAK